MEEDDPLVLPIAGRDGVVRDYQVPTPTADQWVRLLALDAVFDAQRRGETPLPGDAEVVKAMSQEQQLRMSLGDALDQMMADGVDWRFCQAAHQTAYAFRRFGPEKAARTWEKALGKAMGVPAGPPPPSPTSTSTDEVSTTPSEASGSGTTSPLT